jgi:hypothetical protein
MRLEGRLRGTAYAEGDTAMKRMMYVATLCIASLLPSLVIAADGRFNSSPRSNYADTLAVACLSSSTEFGSLASPPGAAECLFLLPQRSKPRLVQRRRHRGHVQRLRTRKLSVLESPQSPAAEPDRL